MLTRRSLLLGGLAATCGITAARPAPATLSRALSVSDLVNWSDHAFVGTPTEMISQWESIGGRDRIVTYSSVRVDHSLGGRPPPKDQISVRTLGGTIDKIAQIVPGEAMLRRGFGAAIFVHSLSADVFAVTGMAQGHYPIFADAEGVAHLHANAVPIRDIDEKAALRRLDGLTILEAEQILSDESARHAK